MIPEIVRVRLLQFEPLPERGEVEFSTQQPQVEKLLRCFGHLLLHLVEPGLPAMDVLDGQVRKRAIVQVMRMKRPRRQLPHLLAALLQRGEILPHQRGGGSVLVVGELLDGGVGIAVDIPEELEEQKDLQFA